MTTAPELIRIEDHEGDGTCSACGREGLRWIAIVRDDSRTFGVGVECAKSVLGWKPAPKSYQWISDFRPIAEHDDCGAAFVLWQHKTRNVTAATRSGNLHQMGGARQEWQRRGWIAAEAA